MKTPIRIHRVDNIIWGRYHSPWFKKFAIYLEKYFDVEWIDYAEHSSQGSANLELLSEVDHFGKNPPISDVDCVIENCTNKEFIILSFTEYFNSYMVHSFRSELCKCALLSHFSYKSAFDWLKKENLLHKINNIKPWFFGSYLEYDIDYFRKIREKHESLNSSKIFWKGLGILNIPGHSIYRDTINYIGSDITETSYDFDFESYMHKMCISKIGLSFYRDIDKNFDSFNYPGEFCYRDMEYCSIGLPFIRIEYKDILYGGLEPYKHYISIPREEAIDSFNKNGNFGVGQLIRSKFFEFINENVFLKYISDNQIAWFDSVCRWPNSAELTIQLSGIEKWI
jgi:hypothetical protein